MFRTKRPVLGSAIFGPLEQLRQAVEVLTGERTCFVHMDLENGRGVLRVGDDEKKTSFVFDHPDLISFTLGEYGKDWQSAFFQDGEVFVTGRNPAVRNTIAGICQMRWVGKSYTERREEPLYLQQAQYCAQVRGMTVEELLNTQS
jgi:hypothetical protein